MSTVLELIALEREAMMEQDPVEALALIREIFGPDATRTDGATGKPENAIEQYETTLNTLRFDEIVHANFRHSLRDDTLVVTHDSCGLLTSRVTGTSTTFGSPQSNRWTFERDTAGRWWATDFTYNAALSSPTLRWDFEDGTHGCWAVRYDEGQPQGTAPVYTEEGAYQGKGALRFPVDFAATRASHAQVIVYNVPFAGTASATLYVPHDAPADLQAGFFAQDYDRDPWGLHEPTQFVTLTPGAWTDVMWQVNSASWARPLHFLGIEVRRAGGGEYKGYVLIDEISLQSR